MNAKESSKENSLIYYAIILLALGLVAYKWISTQDKTLLLHTVAQIGLIIFLSTWLITITIFIIKGYILKEEKSKTVLKTIIHFTNILIIATFIYRTTEKQTTKYFYTIHAVITIIIILYYNYRLHYHIFKKVEEYKIEKRYVLSLQKDVREFLELDLTRLSLDELISKYNYLWRKIYFSKSKKSVKEKFLKKYDDLEFMIERKTQELELTELKDDARIKRQELEDIKEEKRIAQMNEESKKTQILYRLTHYNENVILNKGLTTEEKGILRDAKFKQVNEYCVHQKRLINVFVKPVLNHSPTHTFLVWSTKKLLEDYDVTDITIHYTKDADITFKYNNKYYAIEIETGNLLQKRVQLEEKVYYLNKKYPHRWFFIVSNRNLQAKYKKYGISTQRNRVCEILQEMLENTHPKKLGVHTKSATKNS